MQWVAREFSAGWFAGVLKAWGPDADFDTITLWIFAALTF
jgi:hypothetical protein